MAQTMQERKEKVYINVYHKIWSKGSTAVPKKARCKGTILA